MNRDVTFFSVVAAVIFFVCVVCYFLSDLNCQKSWKLSGFKSDYALFQGCVVEVKPGVWIPAKNVREVP